MVVQHNMQAMNANRMLNITTKSQASSTEKLSSGYKINRAADDAAGLSISEKMRKQIRGLTQASSNAQDGISAVQTAEGALTEVHDMLQRMNELAVQAANGTNSDSDRSSIQDEIDQLTTEIDRVAETTKFNETYLLKGNGKTSTVQITAKDAGIEGTLLGVGTGTATFVMTALKAGDTITIGSKGYTIGTTIDTIKDAVSNASENETVTINGIEYTVKEDATMDDNTDNYYSASDIAAMISDGDTVIYGTQTYVAMVENTPDGVGDNDSSVISAQKAYDLIYQELIKASSVGTDAGYEATTANCNYTGANNNIVGYTSSLGTGAYYSVADAVTQISFTISEGTVEVTQGLQFTLHVGADADENNKIATTISTMDSAGLGIKNINVVDTSGANATYAIDAIEEAIKKVSAQRSNLGAIQNRLDHTINNLDNVVENTTSAESQIRDTDMATEMVNYSKTNILAQAGQAMLAQANTSNQGVLSLLQ
ncbi:MAG: flagellar hook protein [Clostridiales bacterium]|nr:flagellar hook protein [Clostridiales bacterium]